MTAQEPVPSIREAAVIQLSVSMAVLAGIALTVAFGIYMTSRDDILLARRHEEWKRSGQGMFRDGGFYGDSAERLLYTTLPAADFSRPGAYLIGASTIETAVDPLDQVEAERVGIYNYAQHAQTFTQEFHFLRYLVESEGFLKFGADKPHLLIGLCFSDALYEHTIKGDVWGAIYTRLGMFTYDPVAGVHQAEMPALRRIVRINQIRAHVFWRWAFDELSSAITRVFIPLPPKESDPNPAKTWLATFGNDWRSGMGKEFAQLDAMIDYLRAHQVDFKVFYMPTKSWCRAFEPAQVYRQDVLALLARKGVPLSDLSDALPDEDFADSTHIRYSGTKKIGPIILDAASHMLGRHGPE